MAFISLRSLELRKIVQAKQTLQKAAVATGIFDDLTKRFEDKG
jgi:hypothetical protein